MVGATRRSDPCVPSIRRRGLLLLLQIVLSPTQRGKREGHRDQEDQQADRPVDQGHVLRPLDRQAAQKGASGIADQASTAAMLLMRPSSWLGTMAWRRLLVLMLKKIPNPQDSAHTGAASQYELINASTAMNNSSIINPPSAALLNETRSRTGPAASDNTTIPKAPAE
jgi:hypothetical protein